MSDLIQFVYGGDGMDGAFTEEQSIKCRIDVTIPTGDILPGVLQVCGDTSSLELQQGLDEEDK